MTTITINAETIAKLEAAGFNRWTKGSMDRLYINVTKLGLEVDYYKTGNVSSAKWQGELISNADGRRLLSSKVWIDVKTGELHVRTDFYRSYDEELNVENVAAAYVESIVAEPEDEPEEETEDEGTVAVTLNADGTISLNDGISMEVSHSDGDVYITLYGIDIPEGKSWLDYSEYAIESWGGYREPLIAWLTERGVSATNAEGICQLASNLNDFSLNC